MTCQDVTFTDRKMTLQKFSRVSGSSPPLHSPQARQIDGCAWLGFANLTRTLCGACYLRFPTVK